MNEGNNENAVVATSNLAEAEDIHSDVPTRHELHFGSAQLVDNPRLYRGLYIDPPLKHAKELAQSQDEYIREVMKKNLEILRELRHLQSSEVNILTADEADEILAAHMSDLEIDGFVDKKTNLFNETGIKDRLAAAISHTLRAGEPLSIGMMDLRGFKPVNDHISHEAGDRVLDFVGRHLKARVRTEDTIGRLGGDEFILIFQGITAEDMSERLEGSMDDKLADFVRDAMLTEGIDPKDSRITGRLGIVDYKQGDSVSSLMSRVDDLVNAKRAEEKATGKYNREQVLVK